MKKMSFFFWRLISIVLCKKIKKRKKIKKNKCKDLIYSFSKQNSCKQEHYNGTIKSNKNKLMENKILFTSKKELIHWYKKRTKKNLDIENPKTFNEKFHG